MTKDKFEQTFIINMISLRRASGLSQKEFAAEIGVNREKVRNWENYRIHILLDDSYKVSKFFGYSMEVMGSEIIVSNTTGIAA